MIKMLLTRKLKTTELLNTKILSKHQKQQNAHAQCLATRPADLTHTLEPPPASFVSRAHCSPPIAFAQDS